MTGSHLVSRPGHHPWPGRASGSPASAVARRRSQHAAAGSIPGERRIGELGQAPRPWSLRGPHGVEPRSQRHARRSRDPQARTRQRRRSVSPPDTERTKVVRAWLLGGRAVRAAAQLALMGSDTDV
ncbi:hypothetical protein [Streptomyces sp. NPDC101166]|uniref:ALF repeat-containing protein n=1 Tax=Streptomyces sp. NPDC101166 TaxID=3366120 RepID=UPI00381D9489